MTDHSGLIKKEIFENSEELHFHMRDLKQWEAEIKANDRRLIQAAQRASDNNVGEKSALTNARNKESSEKAVENTPCCKGSESCKTNDNMVHFSEEVEEQQMKQRAILEKEKGNNYLKIGEYDKAIQCYSKGLEMDPYNPLLPANRALAHIKKEQFLAAEEDCNLAITMDPSYVKVYQRRATARLALRKFDQAKADFLEVLQLEPQNKDARNQLSKIEKILTEADAGNISVLPINKQPHQYSKVQLRRINVVDIPGKLQATKTTTEPVVSVQNSAETDFVGPVPKHRPELPKPPQTSFEFQVELRRLKSYPELVYDYVKQVPCEKYAQFFQHNLESESLSQMFVIFRDFYMWNNDDIYGPLFNLSQTTRFPTLKMFFSETDKQVLKEIFDHLMQTHAYSMEHLISLKQCYDID